MSLKVDNEAFEILLNYIEGLKGKSREKTEKAAEELLLELEKDDSVEGNILNKLLMLELSGPC